MYPHENNDVVTPYLYNGDLGLLVIKQILAISGVNFLKNTASFWLKFLSNYEFCQYCEIKKKNVKNAAYERVPKIPIMVGKNFKNCLRLVKAAFPDNDILPAAEINLKEMKIS